MIYLASKTLKAIQDKFNEDQGASYREWLGKVIPHMDDAYRPDNFPFRSHLGASSIGKNCAREIWYSFRWATLTKHNDRLLRLFNRGHLEEARFIALLLCIGAQVFQQDEEGKQFKISDAGGHFGGSGDGIAINIPELQLNQAALAEFKTSADKPFKKLVKEGVYKSKFIHYVQMQVYMRKMGIPVALYMCVNKNDDDLYAELIYLDTNLADEYINRGIQLVFTETAPSRISENAGWFECKWCDHKEVCHNGKKPHANCRTCNWSAPHADGNWYCRNKHAPQEYHNKPLTKKQQFAGCAAWERHKEI